MRRSLLERLPRAGQICLFIAVMATPIIFYRKTSDIFNLVKLTTLWVFGISALLLWVAWAAESGIWLPRIRLGLAAGIFVAVIALATAFSTNRTTSLMGLYQRYGGLLPTLLYAAVFVAIVGLHWRKPEGLSQIAWASAIASFVIGGYVLIQAAGWDWIKWTQSGGGVPFAPVGTMGNSNFVGGYLGITVPFLIFISSSRRDSWKWVLFVATGGVLLALYLTGSRGGMIAAAIGVGVLGIANREAVPAWARWAGAVAVLLAAIVAVIVIWHPGMDAPPSTLAERATLRTDTLNVRRSYWRVAAQIFLDHPVLGTGPDTYRDEFPRYRTASEAGLYAESAVDKPHNIFFEYAANSGGLGLIAYGTLVLLALRYGYSAARTAGPHRALSATFLGVLAGYLGQGALSIDLPPLASMGWIALGGIAVLADPAVLEARKNTSKIRRGNVRWTVHGAIALVLIVALVVGSSPVRADAELFQARVKGVAGKPAAELEEHYRRSIRLNPLEPQYDAIYGRFAERQGELPRSPNEKRRWFRRAVVQYQRALKRQPDNVNTMVAMASANARWGALDLERFKESDRWWKRALSTDPHNWITKVEYARTLLTWSTETSDSSLRRRSEQLIDEVAALDFPRSAWTVRVARYYIDVQKPEKAKAVLEAGLENDPFDNDIARELLDSLS